MAVLPDCFGDDEGGILGDGTEDLHAIFLTVDEAVTSLGVELMAASDGATFLFDGRDEQGFHGSLSLFTFLIGGSTKVAVGNENDVLSIHRCV